MNNNFETFLLYYSAFHEGEISLTEMKEFVLSEVGEAGLKDALETLRQKKLEREALGVKNKTLYDYMKSQPS